MAISNIVINGIIIILKFYQNVRKLPKIIKKYSESIQQCKEIKRNTTISNLRNRSVKMPPPRLPGLDRVETAITSFYLSRLIYN